MHQPVISAELYQGEVMPGINQWFLQTELNQGEVMPGIKQRPIQTRVSRDWGCRSWPGCDRVCRHGR